MDCSEGKDFEASPEEEVTRAEEAPLYNQLPEEKKLYALFTDETCRILGSSGGGRLLYGTLHDKARKVPREKVSPASLPRWKPSSWL